MPQQLREPSLPPGLSPIVAGRLGLWLLNLRSQRAAKRRIAFPGPRSKHGKSLVLRFCRLIVPWRIYEYPGERRYLAAVCGISIASAEQYLKPSFRLPLKTATRLAVHLEQHASECEALARELRDYANRGVRKFPKK